MNIPTAEEFLIKENLPIDILSGDDINYAMVAFAKMHVEAALKEALESIPCLGSSSDIPTYNEVEDAVLNAYPLTNLK